MRMLTVAALLLSACGSVPLPECWLVETQEGYGSSVPIAQRGEKLWLLTAKHNMPALSVGGLLIADTILHPERDVALVSVLGTAQHLAPLARSAPKFGDLLHAEGYQHGALLITLGYQGSEPTRMSCPIIFGASGGPVWNREGELVGIVEGISMLKTPKDDSYAVPHVSHYEPVIDLRGWIFSSIK